MSMLNNFLKGIDVHWKTLGDVLNIKNGKDYKSFNQGNIPVYGSGGIMTYIDTPVYNKPSVLIPRKGSLDKLYYVDSPFWTVDTIFWTEINTTIVEPKFVYYFLKTQHLEDLNMAGGVPSLTQKVLNKVPFPVPCSNDPEKSLKIQSEIIRILDSFSIFKTDLTKNLSVELDTRIKQFKYYREELFKFEKGTVGFKLLDEIGEFQRGKRFVKTDLVSEGVPTIHYGEMYTHYGPWADKTISFVSQKLVDDKKLRVAKKGDVVIVAAGETIEDIGQGTAWLGNEGAVIHDACFGFRSPLNPKYVAYFTRTRQFHDQIRKHIRTGKISAINSKGLSKVIIPVPTSAEQKRIVSILDKFDTITNSISRAIPKEIKLRENQYEYYRDLLLKFPKETLEA